MILADYKIKTEIENGSIIIDPYDESLVNPASLDFRLGDSFKGVVANGGGGIDPTDKSTFMTLDRHANMLSNGSYLMAPKEFLITTSLESLTLPGHLACIIKGKSSLGRLGLTNSSMAGFVDPGWSGPLTLELYNHGSEYILLTPGMKIGQFVFYKVNMTVQKNYKETGRYFNQEPGQGSMGI